jgi:M6 family metalloprotease-like protein
MKTPHHYPPKKLSVIVCMAIFLLLGIALPPCAESAPLVDFPVTVKQPDGTPLHLYVSGDEHYNRLHDREGYTIIQDPATGYYVYAVLESHGDLVSSGYAVGSIHPKSAGLERAVRHSPEKIREKVEGDRFLRQTFLTGGQEPIFAPKKGTINNLVVFIRFSDEAEFTDTIDTYETMFNNAAAGANSMANYFREISYDQLSISTTFYPIPVLGNVRSYQDIHPRAYYEPYNAATNPSGYQNSGEKWERAFALVQNAVNAIAPLVPSSLNLDEDSDGNVDNICLIVYGAPGGWDDFLWPHKGQLSTKEAFINDKRVWTYNMQFQTVLPVGGVGTLAHEMLHSLGFPDLYHYYHDGVNPAWKWDVMDTTTNPPQHPLAYMKHRYGGWIESIPTITTPGTYTLNPLASPTNNAYRINSPYATDEYFVVEYRRKTGTFEGSLPGEGLLVYRIDRTKAGLGNGSSTPNEVYVYRPRGGDPGYNGHPENAAFSSNSGRTVIHDGLDPSPLLVALANVAGGLYLYNVSAIADTISFTVVFPPFLAKTGQTQSYATGDDGEIQSGFGWPEPRFTASGECIQDNLTGLVWTKRGNLPAPPGEWQYLWWGDAIDYAKNLAWCGCSTWRLPNINELESVLNIGSLSPYSWLYGQGFSDIGAAKFWSSTARAVDGATQNPTAWTQEFFDGKMSWVLKGTWDYTWPVCGVGTDGPGRLLRTGQTGVDRAGDDGTYQAGRVWPWARTYILYCDDDGPCPDRWAGMDCDGNEWNNLVLDTVTGLLWTRYASSIGLPAPCNKSIFKNWQNALDYIECLNDNQYLGFTDWRLPNKNELRSLIDYSNWSPAIAQNQYYKYISAGGTYWSSTTVGTGGEQTKAVVVDLTHGQTDWALKTNANAGYGVWPVRTAKSKVSTSILSVTKEGAGQGAVVSFPAGIDCGATCTFSFDAGQAVTLSASGSVGSALTGWSGCDSLTGNNCNVTMDDDRGVTASFALATYLLTVNKLGQGSGTVTSTPGINCGDDCSESYTGGAKVTLTAAADSGSAFIQWSGCDSAVENTCTVTMTSNKLVGATFVPLYTLTAAKSGKGSGTVTSAPAGIACGSDCTEPYPRGTVVTLTASPTQGSVFTGWSGGGCSGTGTCTVTMNGDRTVTAAFTPAYSLTVTRQGGGSGTVASDPAGINCGTECSFSYITGLKVTLTATPAQNSVFSGWTGCDNATGNTCTVTMVTNKFVYASFDPVSNLLTLSVTKSGSGEGKVASSPAGIDCGNDCSEQYVQGTQVTLMATPIQGSAFTGWSGGGCSGAGACVVTMNSATTVNAAFTKQGADPLDNWHARKAKTDQNLWAGAFGKSIFVAAGGGGAIVSSPNGNTWTPRNTGVQDTILNVIYANGLFVAVGQHDLILTSPDGIAWTSHTSAALSLSSTDTELHSVAYGKGTYMAVGKGSVIATSVTGKDWTGTTLSETVDLYGIAYGNNTFVAVGANGVIMTTASGTSWQTRSSKTAQNLWSVTYGSGRFIAVGDAGTILTSSNGVSWQTRSSGVSTPLRGVSYGNNTFVVVGPSGTVFTSPDGIAWQARNPGVHTGLHNTVYGKQTFLLLGAEGTIFQSDPLPVSPQYPLTVTKSGTGNGTVTSNPAGISCGAVCGKSYAAGTSVTLTATPSSGSTFTGWSGGGCSGTGSCKVTMNAALTLTATFTLIPCTYTLSPTSKAYAAAGGSVTVNITGKGQQVCSPPAVVNPYPWLDSTTPTWDKNGGQVKLTAHANATSVERSGTVTIGDVFFPVSQAGVACVIKKLTLSVSSFPKTEALGMFAVQVAPQDCAWTATASADWIHLFSGAGIGDSMMPIVVDENPAPSNRTGTINVILSQPPNKKKNVTVTQQGN